MPISTLHGRGRPRALHVHVHHLRPRPRLHLHTYRALNSTTSLKSDIDTYDLPVLTKKWQPFWNKTAMSENGFSRPSAYVLPMFPYPSGTLHLGHLRVYTISDVLARVKRMMGYEVLHPIGWDAFGLPAENAAIDHHVHPADWTARNIEAMKSQMMAMGGQWDWDKEFRTCDPDFYKHTQRLFLLLYKRKLAYRAKSVVNWDPVDQTVLANEQVDVNGCSWRSGAKVEKKELEQWFLKIRKFKRALLEDLDTLTEWPETVIAMQRNWIGRSQGTEIKFELQPPLPDNYKEKSAARKRELRGRNSSRKRSTAVFVFTTRADTLSAVQYLALSLEHPLVRKLSLNNKELYEFIKRAKKLPPDSKEGFRLPLVGRNPLAPITNDTADRIPVFVAPYVRSDYGTGVVMGVPGHDARDHAFWRQQCGDAPVKYVITRERNETQSCIKDEPWTEKGYLLSTDPKFAGLSSHDAIEKITDLLQKKRAAIIRTEWRLKDWLISRQRYWGTPIPIVHCKSCGAVPVPVEDLPVRLPDLPASYFEGRNGNPLEKDEEWKNTQCPKCKQPAHRETDTMDTFMDSSWYFFRFLDPKNADTLFSPSAADRGMPVDTYVGGIEHAILHLLYARFITKFLALIKLWPKGYQADTNALGEPFKRLITQGMVHGKTYTDLATGRFLRPDQIDFTKGTEPLVKETGLPVKISYEKMSKSKYNGVDAGNVIETYGADVTRVHMLFQAPVSDVLEWDEAKITGAQRWLKRMLKLSTAPWCPEDQTTLSSFSPPADIDSIPLWLEQCQRAGMLPQSLEPQTYDHHELFFKYLHPKDRDLLANVHKTIATVTKYYTETYSLNTVVSGLMSLTNAIWDAPHVTDVSPVIRYIGTLTLLRLAAPIAPAVAEEGWHVLQSKFNAPVRDIVDHPLSAIRPDGGPSVFSFGFPVFSKTIIRLSNEIITCVVQVNSKKRFQTEIRKFDHAASSPSDNEIKIKQEEVNHVLAELVKTQKGKEWFHISHDNPFPLSGKIFGEGEENAEQLWPGLLPKGWDIFIAKQGGIVNFVETKRKFKKGEEKE